MKIRSENHTPFIWLIGRIFVILARLKLIAVQCRRLKMPAIFVPVLMNKGILIYRMECPLLVTA